jgi:plastocyanin
MQRTRRTIATLTIALVIASIGVPTASAATLVRGSSMRWHPATATIARGGVIKWKAVDTRHTVTSYGASWSFSRSLAAGTSTTRTFNRAGTYRYYCTIHGSVSGGTCTGMCGKIVVG